MYEEFDKIVEIDYTNYKGIRSIRKIIPISIQFYSNQWHPEPQWLLCAYDIDKGEDRCFAIKDIHSWKVSSADD